MSNKFDLLIGQQIRHQRQLRGMTQQELAKRLGVTFQQVQKYESGANRLSFERAHCVSHIFNVSLSSLLQEAEAAPIAEVEHDNRQALRLLQSFHAIQNADRRSLLCAMAQALAEGNASSANASIA